MEVGQPPRRQAAIKATTNLVESSSDEDKGYGTEVDDYHAIPRVTASKAKRNSKGNKTYGRKHSKVNPKGVATPLAGATTKKRKRATTASVGSQRKRQRGATQGGSGIRGDGVDDESDLTPLSSDDEQGTAKPFSRPLAVFPMQFASPASSSKQEHRSRPRSETLETLSLDEDSDDLPDVGTVLSQHDFPTRKGKKRKPPTSNSKHRPKSRRKHSQDDSPLSFASSPTLPPTLPPSSLPRRVPTDGNATEINTSDHFDRSYLSDDSDLELDNVTVGDLCLAKAKDGETAYWPAKILEVKRPPSGKGKQKKMYRVIFLDKKEKDIPRNRFFVSTQDEFYTCTIGLFESSHTDVVNDFDEESQQNDTRLDRASPRSRSPSPVDHPNPPILPGPDFCDLPLPHQLPYVTPILKVILNEQATWALRRHKMYMKGGATRQNLKDEGGLRGAMDAKNADDFLPLVEKWCLGVRGPYFVGDPAEETRTKDPGSMHVGGEESGTSELATTGSTAGAAPLEPAREAEVSPDSKVQGLSSQPKESGTEDPLFSEQAENPPESEPPVTEPNSPLPPPPAQLPVMAQQGDPVPRTKRQRQRGCPDYENLSPLDKVQYCLDVLVPEALNQILLWRKGERRSVEVMWDNVEEEERLHERGEELLRETDWVMDIVRLRNMMEASFRKGKSAKSQVGQVKEKSLRRTRSGRVGSVVGSYKE